MKMRTFGLALTVVLGLGATARVAEAAPIGVGPRLFLDLDNDSEFALGAEARFGVFAITPTIRLDVRPYFDYIFVDSAIDVTVFDFGADALFAFDIGNAIVEPYALAGLSIVHASADGGGSSTDAGLNLGGGAKFLTSGRIQPFAELRVTIGGDFDPFFLGGGVLFIL